MCKLIFKELDAKLYAYKNKIDVNMIHDITQTLCELLPIRFENSLAIQDICNEIVDEESLLMMY